MVYTVLHGVHSVRQGGTIRDRIWILLEYWTQLNAWLNILSCQEIQIACALLVLPQLFDCVANCLRIINFCHMLFV